jgi:hypothetical protein
MIPQVLSPEVIPGTIKTRGRFLNRLNIQMFKTVPTSKVYKEDLEIYQISLGQHHLPTYMSLGYRSAVTFLKLRDSKGASKQMMTVCFSIPIFRQKASMNFITYDLIKEISTKYYKLYFISF